MSYDTELTLLAFRAKRAGMSLWAYAVHTGRSRDALVATFYRAQTDFNWSLSRIAAHLRTVEHPTIRRWFVRAVARLPGR